MDNGAMNQMPRPAAAFSLPRMASVRPVRSATFATSRRGVIDADPASAHDGFEIVALLPVPLPDRAFRTELKIRSDPASSTIDQNGDAFKPPRSRHWMSKTNRE
jgi:hypothetical protein